MTTQTADAYTDQPTISRVADDLATLMRHRDIAPLPQWSFQPDSDTPGVYLQCETFSQRDFILKILGYKP